MFLYSITAYNVNNTKNKTVATVALPVNNKVIVIDAGHGVPDEGAQSSNGTTDGANQKYTITESDEAKFRINADFSKFVDGGKVYVDNELVDSKNYTAESGSTIITLKKAFVDKLSVGEHTLKVVFNDGGEASTMFNVARVEVLIDNPSTYDNVFKYIGASIISVIGLVSVGIYSYRRKQN